MHIDHYHVGTVYSLQGKSSRQLLEEDQLQLAALEISDPEIFEKVAAEIRTFWAQVEVRLRAQLGP